MISNTHETRNATPPKGVMAPKMLILVTLNMYRLPENKMIPININHPDHDKRGDD